MTLRILSLGAGVQSTTMALMAAHGEIGPMPDCAIFADTGWEPRAVHEHLAWLTSPNVLPFPVHIIRAGNIRDDIIAGHSERAGRFDPVPWFTRTVDSRGVYQDGMGRRECTGHYKIDPIAKKVRELLGKQGRVRIAPGASEIWIGISTDEAARMKPPKRRYMTGRWPLIDAGMSRADCLVWIAAKGYPQPPKSSCIGCPFHSNAMWRALRDKAPEEWADAVALDAIIRNGQSQRGIRAQQFMHPSRVPLAEADLSDGDARQINLWNNECEGMCGV